MHHSVAFLALTMLVAAAVVHGRAPEPRAYALRPYPGDCATYYSCASFKCPSGMVFDESTGRCVPRAHRRALLAPRDETAMFPDPSDPTVYWECTRMPCPTGLEFNPVTLKCDDPMTAGCQE